MGCIKGTGYPLYGPDISIKGWQKMISRLPGREGQTKPVIIRFASNYQRSLIFKSKEQYFQSNPRPPQWRVPALLRTWPGQPTTSWWRWRRWRKLISKIWDPLSMISNNNTSNNNCLNLIIFTIFIIIVSYYLNFFICIYLIHFDIKQSFYHIYI